jgi:uncharacterized membrane protein
MINKFISFQQWFWTEYLDDGAARFGFSVFSSMALIAISLVLTFFVGSLIPLYIVLSLVAFGIGCGIVIAVTIFFRNRVNEWKSWQEKEHVKLLNMIKHGQ